MVAERLADNPKCEPAGSWDARTKKIVERMRTSRQFCETMWCFPSDYESMESASGLRLSCIWLVSRGIYVSVGMQRLGNREQHDCCVHYVRQKIRVE